MIQKRFKMSKIEKLEKLIEENKFTSNAEKRRVEQALKELKKLGEKQ